MNNPSSYKIEIDGEGFEIGADMVLISFVNMLNKLNLTWTIPFEQSNLDYLLLEIESGLKVYYYLENGQLERIIKYIS